MKYRFLPPKPAASHCVVSSSSSLGDAQDKGRRQAGQGQGEEDEEDHPPLGIHIGQQEDGGGGERLRPGDAQGGRGSAGGCEGTTIG